AASYGCRSPCGDRVPGRRRSRRGGRRRAHRMAAVADSDHLPRSRRCDGAGHRHHGCRRILLLVAAARITFAGAGTVSGLRDARHAANLNGPWRGFPTFGVVSDSASTTTIVVRPDYAPAV